MTEKRNIHALIEKEARSLNNLLDPNDVKEFKNLCINKYNLNVEGLMCIPPINEAPKKHFMLLNDLNKKVGLSKLSMGMSNDYEEAIDCGSDYIRIGTLLFGDRQ